MASEMEQPQTGGKNFFATDGNQIHTDEIRWSFVLSAFIREIRGQNAFLTADFTDERGWDNTNSIALSV
jgi:hypothetical protein